MPHKPGGDYGGVAKRHRRLILWWEVVLVVMIMSPTRRCCPCWLLHRLQAELIDRVDTLIRPFAIGLWASRNISSRLLNDKHKSFSPSYSVRPTVLRQRWKRRKRGHHFQFAYEHLPAASEHNASCSVTAFLYQLITILVMMRGNQRYPETSPSI